MSKTKICHRCKRELPADKFHFYATSNTKDKLHSACKECEGHKFSKPKLVAKDGHKFCSKCNRELPANLKYFYSDKECLHGVSSVCKECLGHSFMVREIQHVVKGYKTCSICHNNLPYTKEYFYGSGESLRTDCKECESKKNKIYYDKNIEEKRRYSREWYHKNCADNEEYKTKNVARAKMHRITNQHTQKYKISQRIKSQRRRSLKKKLPSTLTANQWALTVEYFGNKCAYCGNGGPLVQDHFIPIHAGGEYSHNNIIPSCVRCNSHKSAKNFFTWYPTFKCYSKKRETKILKYLGYTNGIQQLSLI